MTLRKLFDFKPQDMCLNPEHEPPKHIVLSPGVYEHECPSCGKVTRFFVYGYTN